MADIIAHMETVNIITLSEEEAADLYRFTHHSYISPTTYPALTRLLVRVEAQVRHGKFSEPYADR